MCKRFIWYSCRWQRWFISNIRIKSSRTTRFDSLTNKQDRVAKAKFFLLVQLFHFFFTHLLFRYITWFVSIFFLILFKFLFLHNTTFDTVQLIFCSIQFLYYTDQNCIFTTLEKSTLHSLKEFRDSQRIRKHFMPLYTESSKLFKGFVKSQRTIKILETLTKISWDFTKALKVQYYITEWFRIRCKYRNSFKLRRVRFLNVLSIAYILAILLLFINNSRLYFRWPFDRFLQSNIFFYIHILIHDRLIFI